MVEKTEVPGGETALEGGGGQAGPAAPVFATALCAVDGKPGGYEAARQAARLVGPLGHLTMLIVTSCRHEGDLQPPAIGPDEAALIVEQAKEIGRAAGVPTSVEVEPAAPPARVVLDWAVGYDLLAIGAPSGSWLGGMVVAGVGDAAIGALETPVLAARGYSGRGPFEHLLAASDAHEDCEAALAAAGGISARHGSRMTLLHALGHGHASEREHELLSAQRAALGPGEVELRVERGRAHELIVQTAATLPASLVIVGSRRRSGPRALGSVSRRVVHEAPCSVLTVPPG